MINWIVRFKNKTFWITIIPAFLVLIQLVAGVFGFKLDLGDLGNKLLQILDVIFIILAAFGIVTDHTTEGLGDSRLALTYTKPKAKGK